MCGVAGFLAVDRLSEDRQTIAERMAKAIQHRGPDSHGIWHDNGPLTLVHTRLAIVDLTKEGHQPMRSKSGRYTISFNGEFYNYAELWERLKSKGISFRGHSDTEIFIEAIEAFGLDEALQSVCGMFALALFDKHTQRLHLIRDRLGEKPLYYGRRGNNLVFGSELKVLHAFPGFPFEIDSFGFQNYLKYNYVPAPHCIIKDAWKVEPAQVVTFNAENGQKVEEKRFWNLDRVVRPEATTVLDENEAMQNVEDKLSNIVARQLRADVPVGCFLSGGVDSTLIAALAQKNLNQPLKTFTIGFDLEEYNEAPTARQVAAHLGTSHQEWIVRPADILGVIPSMPTIYDEPFADASQLPTTLLAQLTRKAVTVCLSGDGGDELFGGYNRYLWTQDIWRFMHRMPKSMNRALGSIIESLPPSLLNSLNLFRIPGFSTKVGKVGGLLGARSQFELYDRLLSCWTHPDRILAHPQSMVMTPSPFVGDDLVEYMMREDARRYLTDDIMVKVDRASMSVALESRAPYLDHQLFELAWRLPLNYKVRGRTGKYILQKILAKHVPENLWARPKSGFAVPLEQWFRSELRDWINDLLSDSQLKRNNIFNVKAVRRCLEEHQKGIRNWQYQLWNIVMFQAWYDKWVQTS